VGPTADKSRSPFAGLFLQNSDSRSTFAGTVKEEVMTGRIHAGVVSTIGAVLFTVATVLAAAPAAAQDSAIEGTWELLR
jgi:hypothetical protein